MYILKLPKSVKKEEETNLQPKYSPVNKIMPKHQAAVGHKTENGQQSCKNLHIWYVCLVTLPSLLYSTCRCVYSCINKVTLSEPVSFFLFLFLSLVLSSSSFLCMFFISCFFFLKLHSFGNYSLPLCLLLNSCCTHQCAHSLSHSVSQSVTADLFTQKTYSFILLYMAGWSYLFYYILCWIQ